MVEVKSPKTVRDAFYQEHRQPVIESMKWASTRGGYTTIQAQYQVEKCTAIWGPYGLKWGLRDLQWNWIYGKDHAPVYVQLDCMFFWSESKGLPAGAFEMSTGWAFDGKDSDVLKKAQTDCISKALSKLGVDSDVFKGLWAQSPSNPLAGVIYVGNDPARDVPTATTAMISHLEDVLFKKLDKIQINAFALKLDDLNWNHFAVKTITTKIEAHLAKKEKDVSKTTSK